MVLLVAFTGVSIFTLDIRLAESAFLIGAPFDRFFSIMTDAGKSIWYLGPIAVVAPTLFVASRLTGRKGVSRLLRWFSASLGFVFAAIFAAGLAINIIKFFVGRARPVVYFQDGFFGLNPPGLHYHFQSFPSGHTSTFIALALSLAFFFPKHRIALLVLGSAFALTRVLVTAHFLSDVIAGGLVAMITSLGLLRLYASKGVVFSMDESGSIFLAKEGRMFSRIIARRFRRFRQSLRFRILEG